MRLSVPTPIPWVLILTISVALAFPGFAAGQDAQDAAPRPEARISKVLPHYLDREGRHTISPSLFDRDAYQFELRHNASLRSGLRFDVLWKSKPGKPGAFTIKLELRGSRAPQQAPVIVSARAFARGGFSQWTRVPLKSTEFEALGELVAWKVTLWREDELLAEQQSFLW